MIGWLAACTEPTRETLADERRGLGVVALGTQELRVAATFRGWRYSAGWGEDGPALGRTSFFVSFEVETAVGTAMERVRGDVDATWELTDRAQAEAAWEGLRLDWCAGPEVAAYRVLGPSGDATPWRVWVPDEAGGAGGFVERPPGTCEEALAWAGDAETWRTVHASHPAVCAHLAHLSRRDDAVRCLLREPPKAVGRHTSRQDLPGGADDPEFDDRLLRVLADTPREGAATFVPYRVVDLTAELRDRAGLADLASSLAARPEPALPWEALLVAGAAAARGDEALLAALVARLGQRDAAGVAATRMSAEMLAPRWPDRSRELRSAARAAVVEEVVPWLPPEYEAGPACPAEHRPAPERCAR